MNYLDRYVVMYTPIIHARNIYRMQYEDALMNTTI